MTLDDLLIDKRIVRRNIEKGRLDAATYRRMLAELPDRSGNLWRGEATSAAEPVRAAAPAPAPAPAGVEERAEPSVTAPFPPMTAG